MEGHDVILVNEKQEARAIFPGPQQLGWGKFNCVSTCALFFSWKTMIPQPFSGNHSSILPL